MNARSLLAVSTFALSAQLVLASCAGATADHSVPEPRAVASASAVRVEVVEIRPSEARLELALPGEIMGSRDAILAAPLGGYVERVRVDDGAGIQHLRHAFVRYQ